MPLLVFHVDVHKFIAACGLLFCGVVITIIKNLPSNKKQSRFDDSSRDCFSDIRSPV